MTDYPAIGAMVEGYDYAAPITFHQEYGWLASGQLPPAECIEDCSAGGAVDEAVAYWVKALAFNPPRDLAVGYPEGDSAHGTIYKRTPATKPISPQHACYGHACGDISDSGELARLSDPTRMPLRFLALTGGVS